MEADVKRSIHKVGKIWPFTKKILVVGVTSGLDILASTPTLDGNDEKVQKFVW